MNETKEINLAFSGGGCKIVYYSSLLRMLEKKNIKPIGFTGVSSGSFIAMPAAAGYEPEDVEFLLEEYYKDYNKLIFKPRWKQAYGLFSNELIGDIMQKVCEDKGIKRMSDFPYPIVVKAVNALTGEPVLFSNMTITGYKVIHNASPKDAIMASTAFPGLYKGVWVEDDEGRKILCTDGGARGNVCIAPIKRVMPETEVWAYTYRKKVQRYAKSNSIWSIAKKIILSSLDYITESEFIWADKVFEMPRMKKEIGVLDIKTKYFNFMKYSGQAKILEWLS